MVSNNVYSNTFPPLFNGIVSKKTLHKIYNSLTWDPRLTSLWYCVSKRKKKDLYRLFYIFVVWLKYNFMRNFCCDISFLIPLLFFFVYFNRLFHHIFRFKLYFKIAFQIYIYSYVLVQTLNHICRVYSLLIN